VLDGRSLADRLAGDGDVAAVDHPPSTARHTSSATRLSGASTA
jgi:hypothetical protein